MVAHMKKTGIKSAAFIGFNDAYGDGWVTEFTAAFKAQGIKFVAAERYARTDTSVLAQILKIVGENSEAVVIGASGTPRSEEHTSELQLLMRISYAVFCLKKKRLTNNIVTYIELNTL